MKCPNCGTENRADGRFCRSCGQPLPRSEEGSAAANGGVGETTPDPAAASGIICPTCGATVKYGARFCPRCGHAFQRAESASAGGEAAAPPEPETPSGTQPQMGNYVSPESAPGYAQPAQAVPPPTQAPQDVYDTAPPVRGRSRAGRWILWAVGGVILVAALVVAGVLAFSAWTSDPDLPPEEGAVDALDTATPLPTAVEAEATVIPVETSTVTAVATEAATATPAATETAAPEVAPGAGGAPVDQDLYLEVNVSPSEPRVGRPLLVTGAVVWEGQDRVTIQNYQLLQDGRPNLGTATLLPVDVFTPVVPGVEGLPGVWVFTAEQAGGAQIQIGATVTLPDGTSREITSDAISVNVRE